MANKTTLTKASDAKYTPIALFENCCGKYGIILNTTHYSKR
jgi:hypothetical protein